MLAQPHRLPSHESVPEDFDFFRGFFVFFVGLSVRGFIQDQTVKGDPRLTRFVRVVRRRIGVNVGRHEIEFRHRDDGCQAVVDLLCAHEGIVLSLRKPTGLNRVVAQQFEHGIEVVFDGLEGFDVPCLMCDYIDMTKR